MKEYKLTETENRLANMIWEREPMKSTELVKICEEKLNWKKSTTYTMLKRLEKKEIFENNKGIIITLITKEEFMEKQSRQFIKESFENSLPRFLTAFTRNKKLNKKEVEEIQKLIQEYKEE